MLGEANFLERRLGEVRLRGTRPPRRPSNKPLPMPEEEEALKRRCRAVFLQTGPLFASFPLPGTTPTIEFSAEALRTHPRRSRMVIELCSLFILKLVSSLVLYPGILWTNLSPWVCEELPQKPGGPPLPRSRPRGLQRTPPDQFLADHSVRHRRHRFRRVGPRPRVRTHVHGSSPIPVVWIEKGALNLW